MKFTPTIPDDLPQIAEWIASDPHHRDDADAMSWMPFATNCIVSTCVEDKSGPVLYIKVSKEDDFARMSVQFARRTSHKISGSSGFDGRVPGHGRLRA